MLRFRTPRSSESMNALIAKNLSREGPGILELLLVQYRIKYEIVDLDKGEKFPDPLKYKAVFVFGGPDSANDGTAKMREELAQIRRATNAGIPYLGTCLGMQALVKANGGVVRKNETSETGWRNAVDRAFFEIELTEEGNRDPLFARLKPSLKVFHLHGETVELTDGMELLATGRFCKNQAVRIGNNAYGLQGHFELDWETFQTWLREDPNLEKLPREELEADYKKIRDEYEANGRQMLTNFLRIAKLV